MIPRWLSVCILRLDAAAMDTPCLKLLPILGILKQIYLSLWHSGSLEDYPYPMQTVIQNRCRKAYELAMNVEQHPALPSLLRGILFDLLIVSPAKCEPGNHRIRGCCYQHAHMIRAAETAEPFFIEYWEHCSPELAEEEAAAYAVQIQALKRAYSQILLTYQAEITSRHIRLQKMQTVVLEKELSCMCSYESQQRALEKLTLRQDTMRENLNLLQNDADIPASPPVL